MKPSATPRTTHSALQRARDHLERHQLADAQRLLDTALASPQEDAAWHAEAGHLCLQLNHHALAIEHLNLALAQQPDHTDVLADLARLYTATAQLRQAATLLDQLHALTGDTFNTCHAHAYFHNTVHDYPATVDWCRRALRFKPHDKDIHLRMAYALAETDQLPAALEHAELARKTAPRDPACHLQLSKLLAFDGQIDKAIKHANKARELDPLNGLAIEQQATLRTWQADDLPAIDNTEALLQQAMPVRNRASIHFALGKMCDDAGFYDRAFAHYRQANTFGRPTAEKAFDSAFIKRQQALCTRAYLASRPAGDTSDVPVFIVGMPRSGTTLLEQIVASHPLAAGAGELRHMDRLAHQLLDDGQYNAGLLKPKLPPPALLHGLAEDYTRHLLARREHAQRITDKMPENYHLLGIIHLLFPRAKILHLQRHPLDTCLSCYFQQFGESTWSYELPWIADTYHRYRKTMAHWHNTLPAGTILDVSYEALIAQPEQQIRRVLAHIGLPWDDACLDFNANRREVRTVSVMQVRQPLRQTVQHRWTHYARHLAPLASGIAAWLTDEDRAALAQAGVTVSKPWLRR